MTKQEEEELCMLLVKLLADMIVDDDEIYNSCDLGFTFDEKRIIAHIKFEVRDPDE